MEKKKQWRKWKENTKSILRGWRQTPHHGEWAKRELKIGSMRQGSPKESGKDTVFWKLVQPTTDECAKALVHFVGSCSRLARNPYQERYHQVESALRWGIHCQYKLLRGQRQTAHQSVTQKDKIKGLPGLSLIARGTDRRKALCTYLFHQKNRRFFYLLTDSL